MVPLTRYYIKYIIARLQLYVWYLIRKNIKKQVLWLPNEKTCRKCVKNHIQDKVEIKCGTFHLWGMHILPSFRDLIQYKIYSISVSLELQLYLGIT